MQKITILSFGKVKNQNLLNYILELKKRIKNLNFIELKEFKDKNEEIIKKKEFLQIKKYLKSENYNILLSEFGKQVFTKQFYLDFKKQSKPLFFIISGPFGHNKELEKEVDFILSLSKLTLNYQIAKLVLVEQIYRFYCFEKNINYTK